MLVAGKTFVDLARRDGTHIVTGVTVVEASRESFRNKNKISGMLFNTRVQMRP
jgi:hypothetical protein